MKKLYIISALTLFISISLFLNGCKKDSLTEEKAPDFAEKLGTRSAAVIPGTKVALGRAIFFDASLSSSGGQSCSSCHSPTVSFTDPFHNAVSPGAAKGLAGNRNAPTASYTAFNPPFHYSNVDSTYEGGLFLDGRVNTLEEQAMKPFLNPLEMNNSDVNAVVAKVKAASYYPLFKRFYGEIRNVNTAFNNIASAIAEFERSPELSPFTSKYDYYLKGEAHLSAEEYLGMVLFNDASKAKCGNCHLTTPDERSGKILFTDFTYNSDGVPRNPQNPYYRLPKSYNPLGYAYKDYGLGAILNDPSHNGEFRVSSLRNVAVTAPYFHNGVFTTLEQVVHFYNTRDVKGSGFVPEVAENIDTEETGNQHLTKKEETAIVAFLNTLTDGYKK